MPSAPRWTSNRGPTASCGSIEPDRFRGGLGAGPREHGPRLFNPPERRAPVRPGLAEAKSADLEILALPWRTHRLTAVWNGLRIRPQCSGDKLQEQLSPA